MKKIASANAQIYHRHFGEDAFIEIKESKKINDLKIVTYCSLNSLASTLFFIRNHFIKKSSSSTVIIGISGITDKKANEKLEESLQHIENLKKYNLTLYLHTRCHIKMISSDNLLYLGSQNVSGTSNSFIYNSNQKYNEVFNYHEMIVRLEDNESRIANDIVNELISDTHSCFRFLEKGNFTPTPLSKIRHLYRYDVIISHFYMIKSVAESLKDIEKEGSEFYCLEEEFPLDIIKLLSEINQSESSDQTNKSLRKLIDLAVGDEELSEIYYYYEDTLSSAISEMKDSKIPISESERFEKAMKSLTNTRIENIDFGSEYFEETVYSIQEEIHFSGATDIPTYFEFMRDHIIGELYSNQGQYDLHRVINDEGFASPENIEAGIFNNDITLGDQADTLRTPLSSLVNKIAQMLISRIGDHIENELDEARKHIDACILETNSTFSRI